MAPQPVYMLDFSVYKPPEEYKLNHDAGIVNASKWSMYVEENARFQLKVCEKSGLNRDGTFLPPAIHPTFAKEPKYDMKTAMLEAEMVMGGVVADVLEKTGIKPEQVDILITNCSIFCPTPSLSSMLINKFKLRRDIQAYHLGGMGCSIGVIAVALVRDMLQAHPNAICLYVPSEITTYCFYPGRVKDYLVANAIFRMGGAGMVATNKASLAKHAKYQLDHSVRVHTGQDDESYNCIAWGPDPEGINGVYLGKDVPVQAGIMLEAVIKAITPKIMTWSQYAEAAYFMYNKKVLHNPSYKRYVPDYTKCVDHFALHAGGYAVLKGIQKGMNLPSECVIPSFASLRDFGNTSSSTTWYTMAYLESIGAVKRGHNIMQVGAGGGMKGGVNIWRALKDNNCTHPAWRHLNGRAYTEEDLPRKINEPKKAGHVHVETTQGSIMDAIVEEGREETAELGVAAL